MGRSLNTLGKNNYTIQAAGLTLKPSKVQFGPKEVIYLDHVLPADGIRIGDDRIKAIIDLPKPTNIKQLRSVLGTLNFVRKFIPNLAATIAPLVALTKKKRSKRLVNAGVQDMTRHLQE